MKKRIAGVACSLSFALALAAFGIVTADAAATTGQLTEDSFTQIKAHYAGKPLVVHIWGMTCGPCLGELPKWGALRRAHPEMNLVLIQADASPVEASEKALKEAGLSGAESWGVSSEMDEYLRASIDPKWIGDMPRTLMVSANGDVVRMRGVADLSAVRRWLESTPKAHR
jgi:thiol-disulfide isomerase/thioredoxin